MTESTAQRSKIMRAVKSKDTTPEITVRKLLYNAGYRYRLHSKNLPGKPDIVFKGRKKVIFVHGCFWHGHTCKRGKRLPTTNRNYWAAKIDGNVERFSRQKKELSAQDWSVLTVWECELRNQELLRRKLFNFLEA